MTGPSSTSESSTSRPLNDVIRREKDYKLRSVTLIDKDGRRFDMSSHWINITYEEDIFTGMIHGSLWLLDSVDYISLVPIIGEEQIEIVFTRPDEKAPPGQGRLLEDIVFTGRVYDIPGREIQGASHKSQSYCLKFISEGTIESFKKKVNRSFKGVRFSEIVQIIVDEYIATKPIIVETSRDENDWIITNKRPLRSISDILQYSISDNTANKSSYLFFEGREEYKFVTLGYLFDQEPIKSLTYKIPNILANSGSGFKHRDRRLDEAKDGVNIMDNVESYHVDNAFNVIDNLSSANYSSKLITVDPVRRKYDDETNKFDLDAEWGNIRHTIGSDKKTFSPTNIALGQEESHIKMIVTNKEHDVVPHIVEKDPTIKPFNYEESLLYREAHFEQLKRNTISLTMSGDPRVEAGSIIEFKIPKVMGKHADQFPEELDEYLQGNYLVASVAHAIERNSYQCNMQLMKTGFSGNINPRDPVEEYKDVY